MSTATADIAIGRSMDHAWSSLVPPRLRSYREFAEEEIILATGPRSGLQFQCDFMPWTGMVLDEFDGGRYRRFFATGPVQSGKTLLFFVIPIMYHLFEAEESVIVGVPKLELAQGIYEEKLLPSLMQTRYARLLPTRGTGSRGGKFMAVRYGNGAVLRFMGAGGSDAQRSSHTARVVVLTEIDKMDAPGAVSREADPVTQFEARNRAYGAGARLYAECTMSSSEGRVNQEVRVYGTDTGVWLSCPGCGEYVLPEREHFAGWQGASDILAARGGAYFACSLCEHRWTEAERIGALRRPVLAAKGQTFAKGDQLEGEPPATNTWGFRWNAMHSALTTMADIAEAEWRAARSDSPNDAKALMQYTWALPYDEERVDVSALSTEAITHKMTKLGRGIVPDGAERLTVFVDLGMHRCWWAAWAWQPTAEGALIDYGALEVPYQPEATPLAILSTLRTFRDEVLEAGWITEAEDPITHHLCLVDSAWQADVAAQFVRESGQGRYLCSHGMGTARNQKGWLAPKPGKGRTVGQEWALVVQPGGIRMALLHSDHWKRRVHEGLRAPLGARGCLTIFHAPPQEHLGLARQLMAEHQEEQFEPGKGMRVVWQQVRKDNHWLDCAAGAMAAASMLGVRLVGESQGGSQGTQAPDYAARRQPGVGRATGWKIGR